MSRGGGGGAAHARTLMFSLAEYNHVYNRREQSHSPPSHSTDTLKPTGLNYSCVFSPPPPSCSSLDPRVRDALAVYTDDWLVVQRK